MVLKTSLGLMLSIYQYVQQCVWVRINNQAQWEWIDKYAHHYKDLLKIMGIYFTTRKTNTIFKIIENKWTNIFRNRVFYAVETAYPLINDILCGTMRKHIRICSNKIVNFGKRISFEFCNTSYVIYGDKYSRYFQKLALKTFMP